MNLLHVKYAIEVEKTSSISKAAANLLVSQPNLSRCIKELEETLGIVIFKRTSKGMFTTIMGEEFLSKAKKILYEIDEIETMYKTEYKENQHFSISVPRASYIAEAFTFFVKELDMQKRMDIYYEETNSMHAIDNILYEEYNLGIIRYQSNFEQYFKYLLKEKNLISEVVCEFRYYVIMSKKSKFACKKSIKLYDLIDAIEIAHGDPYIPSISLGDAKKAEITECVDKRIFIYERGSQFELLNSIENTYMWVSPVPEELLKRYQLVQIECEDLNRMYKDVLIYKKGYTLSNIDKKFIKKLKMEAMFEKKS